MPNTNNPAPSFSYVRTLLSVQFNDQSLNGPMVSWLWDFGDGSPTSALQNPSHAYASPGFYNVTLDVTNAIGTETLMLTIGVSATQPNPLNQSIWFLIDAYIPPNLITVMDPNEKQALITKWQLYLFPLVEPALNAGDEHIELNWPPLVNELIAELVAYDLIIQGANSFMTQLGNEGSSSSSTTTTSGQQKKSIKTGPTEVEWYEDKTTEELGEVGAAFASALKPGGALDAVKQMICQLSERLRINLPVICGPLKHSPVVPEKSPKTGKESAPVNPLFFKPAP